MVTELELGSMGGGIQSRGGHPEQQAGLCSVGRDLELRSWSRAAGTV